MKYLRELHKAMHKRCANQASYLERKIKVCPEWKGIASFRDYVVTILGPRPDDGQRWTLDRIDGRKDYEPGNLRWATYTTQMRNRPGFNINIVARGESKLLVEWSEETGLPIGVLRDRLRCGWNGDDIVNTPVMTKAEASRRRWRGEALGHRRQ